METKKIRIGNDIRLAVDLRLFVGNAGLILERNVYTPEAPTLDFIDRNGVLDVSEVYYPDQYSGDIVGDPMEFYPTEAKMSIRSVKAKFINTTRREEEMKIYKRLNRFFGRFPMEPGIESFNSTPYDICNSGYYRWTAHPRYNGYGINPNFGGLYNHNKFTSDSEYIADVAATSKQHIIEVMFPAEHQHHIGKYTLVLVVKVFAPGYNSENLKTFTVDIPDVIELVKTSEEGYDTGVIVNVSTIQEQLPEGDNYTPSTSDIFVDGFSVNGNIITIHRTDLRDLSIDIADKTGWYEGD